MKNIDLFVTRDWNVVTNIPESRRNVKLRSLKTRYVTYTSYDENNKYNGYNIWLRYIDCEAGVAHFQRCKEGDRPTHFTMDLDDDPIIVLENEPDVEHRVFEKTVQYEINQDIKEGRLYKFRDTITDEWFLAVVQCVGTYQITLNKFNVIRDRTFSPTLYTVCQQAEIFGISTTDKFCIDKFKNYTVTELCDLTTVFGNDEDTVTELCDLTTVFGNDEDEEEEES